MDYTSSLRPAAERQFARLPEAVKEDVVRTLRTLESEPRHRGVKCLMDRSGVLSARAGDYRILFVIDDRRRKVIVGRIAHRSRVYKRLDALGI